MGVMGSLSQQLIDIYDGRGLQRSHSLGWKQDATLLHWPREGGGPGEYVRTQFMAPGADTGRGRK